MNGTFLSLIPGGLRSRMLLLCAAFTMTAGGAAEASPMLSAPRPDALPGNAVPVAERSGGNHETWDLGPVPGEPEKHRFAVAIHGASGKLGVALPPSGGT